MNDLLVASNENYEPSRDAIAPPITPSGLLSRDLYSADQAELAALTYKAITEKNMVALQEIGNQMKALLNLPIPEGAVFSRFVKNENGALTVNYYTEKNPTATDLLERGHESNSITISM